MVKEWGREHVREREAWRVETKILAKNASDRERSTKECTSTFMVDVFILFY